LNKSTRKVVELTVRPSEVERRNTVLSLLRAFIQQKKTIRMNSPAFSGEVSAYAYSFEGEDDLLHVAVWRQDQTKIEVREAQDVVQFLLPGIPPGLIWIKPGTKQHHFYLGHDEMLVDSKI